MSRVSGWLGGMDSTQMDVCVCMCVCVCESMELGRAGVWNGDCRQLPAGQLM